MQVGYELSAGKGNAPRRCCPRSVEDVLLAEERSRVRERLKGHQFERHLLGINLGGRFVDFFGLANRRD
jgi:hypothetical protein